MLIDSHCHLDGFARRGELAGVIARAAAAGVRAMIAIGTDRDDWELNRRLAAEHSETIHYTIGLHPCSVREDWESALSLVDVFWEGDSVLPVALGECGLDRYHLPKDDSAAAERIFGWQRAAFARQLQIAKRRGCAVVVHSRDAFRECVEMIDGSGVAWSRVVFHCFSAGPKEIAELNERGGRGSFTGILTYKNAGPIREAAVKQGVDRLMVETDAPYLAPIPHRGKPNEPAFVRHTADFAASIFGLRPEDLAATATANTKSFFGIKL